MDAFQPLNLRDVFMASCRLNGEPAALLLHWKLRKCFSVFFTCRAVRWCSDWLLVQFSIKTKEELIVAVSNHSAVYMSWICKRQLPRLVPSANWSSARTVWVICVAMTIASPETPTSLYLLALLRCSSSSSGVSDTDVKQSTSLFLFFIFEDFLETFFLFWCTSRFESLVEGSWRCSASYPRRLP